MRLDRQIQFTVLGSVALAVVAYGVLVLTASHQLERALLDTLVRSEAELLAERLRVQPGAELPRQTMTAAWHDTTDSPQAPAAFRHLPTGISHDVAYQGRDHHVLRQPLGTGILTVAVNIDALERRETALQLTILGGGLTILVVLFLSSRKSARRVAAPLQDLAQQLDRLDPQDSQQPRLAGRYHGEEVAVIAQALDRYVSRLSELVERERDFASSASHELRNPVTVIRSSLELLRLDPALPKHLQGAADRAERSAARLGLVLDGLLLLARDRDGKCIDSIDARASLEELVEELQQDDPSSRIDCHLPAGPVHLALPETHWRMLVSNLIRNARDHAPGRSVNLQLDAAGLAVEDQGPGIADDLLPHVFERSRRGASSGGSGLGLYIAAEICRRQSWTIRAENLHPQGCRIVVGIPEPGIHGAQTRA